MLERAPRLRSGAAIHLKRKRSRGFTLVEVLIASLLLMLAMAGIVPFFIGGLNQASTVRYKSLATNIARERMEQIRQLDYREITEDPNEGVTLSERFGTTAEQRGIQFTVSYAVESSSYEAGLLKKVTVTVSWTAPPKVSPVSITTMIHQQFLGPRGASLELSPTQSDPLGTPFPLISGSNTTIRYHLAQADWNLVFKDVNNPGAGARDVFARFIFFSDDGDTVSLGDPAKENRIGTNYLKYTTDGSGLLTDVWFEYDFDTQLVPDGYWELRALAYNQYEQPGNVWRLRVRVENGAPAAPTDLTAVPLADNETIVLYWLGGPERDRARYVLERSVWDPEAGQWGSWETLNENIDPKAVTYSDQGSIVAEIHPWGSEEVSNQYLYRIYAVDISPGNVGEAAELAEPVVLPPLTTTTTETTTTTTVSTTTTTAPSTTTTTTTLATYSVKITNSAKKHYRVEIRDASNMVVFSGTIKKGETTTVTGLSAGQYQIVATPVGGGTTVNASFSLPAQAGQVVLTLL